MASRIGLIAPPAELAPAAALIRSAKASPDDRRALVTAYAERPAAIARSTGSFPAHDLDLVSQPVALAEAARRDGIAVDGLVLAYREFLVKHLGGPRCGELADTLAESWREQFNERLRLPSYLVMSELAAIQPEDVRPLTLESRPKRHPLCASPKAKELDAQLRRLHTESALEKSTAAERLLGALEEWTAGGGEVGMHFHEKAGFYLELLEMAPAGPLRARIARSWLAYPSGNPMEKTQPMQFLFELRRLLARARAAPAGTPQASGPFEAIEHPAGNAAAIADELADSRDAVIALYADLDKLP
jgi:hypothetical protein